MMKLRFCLLFILTSFFCAAQNENQHQLAHQYARAGECDKAISIYQEFNRQNVNLNSYYSNFYNCLIKTKSFFEAEKLVKRMLRKSSSNPKYKLDLGFIWKAKGLDKKADKLFLETIESVQSGQLHLINTLASTFTTREAHDLALKTYLHGQKVNPNQDYGFQIANIYRNLGKTELMIETFLELVQQKPNKRLNVQRSLQNALARTGGNVDNFELLKSKLLKEVQRTNNTDLTEMLVWLFMQKNEFEAAFIYAKALDKRLKEDGSRIYELASIAHENKNYSTAIKAYDYLIKKSNSAFFKESKILKVISESREVLENAHTKNDLQALSTKFENTLQALGKNITTAYLIKELAHLKGFYLYNIEEASELLQDCIALIKNETVLQAECKLMLADLLVVQEEEWEAILLYSQVEKSFKENPIGHEAKFRRARISYFQGEFDWAQAQLDVLKASTSKLIANNAMDLSLLITDNTGLDTTAKAMQMYARAELLAFQNKWDASLITLDSLEQAFPGHSLLDEALFKKGQVSSKRKDYKQAIGFYKEIVENYYYDILADDALFQWAKLTEEFEKDRIQAQLLYEQILLEHSGSIYTAESRKKLRELRGESIQIEQ